jgi:protoporphyrin/coproporphyrin ferrochelatase
VPSVSSQVSPYDALLLVSFGGPERPEDVVPFLENVTRGRAIPRERLEQVGQHYYLFGGRSPINDLNRDLLAAIRTDLAAAGIDIPVYWGNRNWDPYLTDVLAEMTVDGVTRAACFATSAYSSWSGCRQYRENLYDAVAPLGPGAPRLDKLRHYFNHPGFVEPVAEAAVEALTRLPDEARDGAHLVFVTHSIPLAMNELSGPSGGAYVQQHLDVVAEIAVRVAEQTGRRHEHALVYCSRSGPPSVPWLEPDVNDHLTRLAADDVPGVVLVPVGFVSDHMEVVYDLDTEALETARELQLPAVRAATPQGDARFTSMVRELLVERAAVERGEPVERPSVGALGPSWDACPVGCCRNPAGDRPALCGSDA